MRYFTQAAAVISCAVCLTALSAPAQADIVISGTRIVYKESQKSVNVRLENRGENPLLVQNWLDTGNDNVDPSQISVPFNSTPPVSRIDSKRGQTVKVMYTAASALPKDRESVFWFNVLEVPPKPADGETAGKNMLQLAFRTRIKLFYRPEGLNGIPSEAPKALVWSTGVEKGVAVVIAKNPTPYHVSFSSLNLNAGGRKYEIESQMVVPFGETRYPVKGIKSIPRQAKISFSAINDFGGAVEGSAGL
ncbi:Chaperone protein focC precursor [Leminorella richardii]|uniref:Chaperone protein focC n=1 Tax=Leminorella richardii TaxID=158841 RepID=A0A2X4V8D0_9GAMM|nr:fimbrial chaperone [Leminorella richardii]SQI42972.1 Chaperone protein focC precursor [Leminorella richardii]